MCVCTTPLCGVHTFLRFTSIWKENKDFLQLLTTTGTFLSSLIHHSSKKRPFITSRFREDPPSTPSYQMWADAEIGGQMTEGLEHISQMAKGEFTKDMEMLNHKLQSARLVFDWHWIVGCCIALFAAVSSNIGLNLQRLSHLENQFYDPFAKRKREKPLSEQVGVCARPRWVLGISLMILASLADFVALSFAAQSLVASLGSLSLVANALIAPLIVREKITSREWKAIGLICVGDACCILFGQHKSEVYTLDALMDLYGEAPFIVYAVIVTIAVISIWSSIYWIETVYAPLPSDSSVYGSGRTSASLSVDSNNTRTNDVAVAERTSMSSDHGSIMDDDEATSSHAFSFTYDPNGCVAKYHRFSHAMLSGILGAQSVLLGKSTAELLKTLIAGRGNLFLHLGTYVILISMVGCIVTQVHYLNEALKRVEATIVVPVFQTFWTLVSVCGGFVMYVHPCSNSSILSLSLSIFFLFYYLFFLFSLFSRFELSCPLASVLLSTGTKNTMI